MKTHKNTGDFVRVDEFDSLADFDRNINETGFSSHTAKHLGSKFVTKEFHQGKRLGEKGWLGLSFDDASEVFETGKWAEGAERLKRLTSQVKAQEAMSVRRRRTRGDFGNEVDMQRVYSGQLDRAWSRTKRDSIKTGRKNITLICSVGNTYKVPAEEFLWRGAAACALTDALEKAGYRVQIVAYSAVLDLDRASKNESSCCTIRLKPYETRSDMNALAACLCLAAFLRVRVFQYRCRIPGIVDISQEMGISSFIQPPAKTFNADEGGIIEIPHDIGSASQAQRWLDSQQF